jgi:hypothetical protein
MSEQEAKEIVDAVRKDLLWYAKYQKTAKDILKICYSRNPDDIPLEYRKKIENDNGYKIARAKFGRNKLRWKDFQKVMDRLNSSELLDFYIDHNIFYAHYIPSYHRPPVSVIKEKYGDLFDADRNDNSTKIFAFLNCRFPQPNGNLDSVEKGVISNYDICKMAKTDKWRKYEKINLLGIDRPLFSFDTMCSG